MSTDQDTTLLQMREWIRQFVAERDWEKFHAPKNLAMALAIEAAELMEHFQWLGVDESRQIATSPEKLQAAGEELADVICYSLALANELGLDVASTVAAKLIKNAQKYPAAEFRGRWGAGDV